MHILLIVFIHIFYNDDMGNMHYEKKVIGKLIKYYRLKKNIHRIEIIQISNNKQICSLKTLRKIEEGIVVSDHYYDYLAVGLNLHFCLEEKDLMQLMHYRGRLISSLNVFSRSLMEELLHEISSCLYLLNNVIYFKEMLGLFHDILDYHLNEKLPSRSTIDLYCALKDMVRREDQKLIYYFLYQICHVAPYLDRKQIEKSCLSFCPDPLFIKNQLLYISQCFSLFKAYEKIKQLYVQIENRITDYQKITFYNVMAMMQLNMNDIESAYKMISRITTLLESNHDYPGQLLFSLHMRAAIICYAMKQYEQAIQHALICYFSSHEHLNYNYLLLFSALEKTNKHALLKKILQEAKAFHFHNDIVFKVFQYYQIKHLHSFSSVQKHRLLTDLILSKLMILCSYCDLYQEILTEEMMAHAAHTRDYKNLYIFLQHSSY